MNSMTGWGFAEQTIGDVQITVEVKAVNCRFLDVSVSLPPFLSRLENTLRKELSAKLLRGKVEMSVRVHNTAASNISVDIDAATRYYKAFCQLAHALDRSEESIPLGLVLAQDGVVAAHSEVDFDLWWQRIQAVAQTALDALLADRAREGENLKRDLLAKLGELDECASFFATWQPQMEVRFKELIERKFAEIIGEEHFDESKVLSEVAAMVVRYTINEEVVRLQSHLEALRHEITESAAPGKRLDFICQEANREINTIGSKSQFIEVSQMVIRAKDALENIREQSKNVE